MPAVQENTAGGDQGPAPPDGGWADRIRVPCLLLHDERDLAGERANRSLTLWPSSFVRPTSAPDRGEPVVPSGVVYEARLDPSVMRERPRNHWLQQTLAKLGGERGCRAPDVQGARISSSRGDCRLQGERCNTEIEQEHWGKMAAEWLRMARDAETWHQ